MDLQVSITEMDLQMSITEMVCADFSAGRPKASLWQVFQSTINSLGKNRLLSEPRPQITLSE